MTKNRAFERAQYSLQNAKWAKSSPFCIVTSDGYKDMAAFYMVEWWMQHTSKP